MLYYIIKPMLNKCTDRTICNRTDLMANDWEYITREILKNKCSSECINLSTCHRIVELLGQKKWEQAQDLLK